MAATASTQIAIAAKTAQVTPLVISSGDRGLTSLRYSGTEMLADGGFSVRKAILTDTDGKPADAATTPVRTEHDARSGKITQVYPWGAVSCTYTISGGNRLNLTVGVRNDSASALTGLSLQLLEVAFPQAPQGWKPAYAYFGDNRGNPSAVYANFTSGALAVCNDDVGSAPVLLGFPGRSDLTHRPIWLSTTTVDNYLAPYIVPYLHRTVPSHGFDVYHLSLRFGPGSAREMDLAGDLYRKTAATFPFTLDWKDRRPIGTLHLSASETRLHSEANPRGWFADPKGVDVKTTEGIAAFHKRILKYADDSIAVLKHMGAQGMVTWDIEGQEFPHATSYIGDPRLLKELDPEMDSIADDYFRRFREAGLRVGVCVRPQRLSHTAEKTEQRDLTDPAEIIDILHDKIAYAYRRWGCTLFYVDSNGDPNVPYDPAIFETLTRKLKAEKITALIMPEHRNMRYYACTAPYGSLRNGMVSTPAAVHAAYPQAFIADYVPDAPLEENRSALVDAVRGGDVLMFRAWWNDPVNDVVRGIYREAGK